MVKKSDDGLRRAMAAHYSQPGGMVGRSIVYAVRAGGALYGYTSSQSATKHLPGRDRRLPGARRRLNQIINNGFFHLERIGGWYPFRNFVPAVIEYWEHVAPGDWEKKYGDRAFLFETLVEKPRTGECYLRCGWQYVGTTKGYTCRRVTGVSTDGWSGRRVWGRGNRKRVFVKRVFG